MYSLCDILPFICLSAKHRRKLREEITSKLYNRQTQKQDTSLTTYWVITNSFHFKPIKRKNMTTFDFVSDIKIQI